MDYAHWKLFTDVAELGSLSKAASVHATSQPLISKKISALEAQCGAALFHRTGRGVLLTEFGRTLLPRVRAWLADTERLQHDILSLAGHPAGNICLGAIPSTITPLVVPLYEKLKKDYPFIRLTLLEGQGSQLETWLEEGRIDLALLLRHQHTPHPGDYLLAHSQTWLVGRENDPLTTRPAIPFAELDGVPLATFCRPNSWRTVLDRMAHEAGIRLNIVCEADSLTMLAQVVRNGHAYTLIGDSALASARGHHPLSASRIVSPVIYHALVLGMSRHGKLGIAGKTVIGLIQDIARRSPV